MTRSAIRQQYDSLMRSVSLGRLYLYVNTKGKLWTLCSMSLLVCRTASTTCGSGWAVWTRCQTTSDELRVGQEMPLSISPSFSLPSDPISSAAISHMCCDELWSEKAHMERVTRFNMTALNEGRGRRRKHGTKNKRLTSPSVLICVRCLGDRRVLMCEGIQIGLWNERSHNLNSNWCLTGNFSECESMWNAANM